MPYALIGAHAVNAWLTPRFTADVDITVQADPADVARLKEVLLENGYRLAKELGEGDGSGPDFLSFTRDESMFVVEVQLSKTEFQDEVIARAKETGDGLRVATPEDLIVMKLIANRPKDRIDLAELVQLPQTDWRYVERWAEQWGVADLLSELRGTSRG